MRISSYVVAIALLSTSLGAQAETFSFMVTGGVYSGSGSLTATPDSAHPSAFDITAISGTIAGAAITGLLPCSSYSPSSPCTNNSLTFGYDNLLYPAGQSAFFINRVDASGIGIALSNGDAVQIAASGSHTDTLYFNGQPSNATPITVGFTVSPTPEPSSLLLLGTGLLSLVPVARRRFCRS